MSKPQHRDLSDDNRVDVVVQAEGIANALLWEGQSLAIARECWINAFDAEAERLDGGE